MCSSDLGLPDHFTHQGYGYQPYGLQRKTDGSGDGGGECEPEACEGYAHGPADVHAVLRGVVSPA